MRAQPTRPELALSWEAPAGCPGRSELLGRIEVQRTRSDGGEAVVVRAAVTRLRGGAFQLDLQFGRGEGASHRVLSDPDCSALADATALLVAMALDGPGHTDLPGEGRAPDAGARVGAASAAVPVSDADSGSAPGAAPGSDSGPDSGPGVGAGPAPASASGAASGAGAEVGPTSMPGPRSGSSAGAHNGSAGWPPELAAELQLTLDVGNLPSAAPGLAAGARLGWGPWALHLRGFAFYRGERAISATAGQARADLLGAQASLCVALLRQGPAIGTCLDAELARYRAWAVGTRSSRTPTTTWLAGGPALFATLPLGGRLGATLRATLLIPASRATLRVATGADSAWTYTTAPLSMRLGAGLAYLF